MLNNNLNSKTNGEGQDVQITEQYLTDNLEFRRNCLNAKVEFRERKYDADLLLEANNEDGIPIYETVEQRWRPLTDEALNTIIRRAKIALPDVEGLKTNIVEYLFSEDIPLFDPVKQWLDDLPEWDGRNWVADYFGRIPGITNEQIQRYGVWLRSTVAHWLQLDTMHGNENIAMLIGDQGCGKTIFWRRLLPPELQEYFLDRFNFANKFDSDMALSNNLIVNIDEIDQLTPSQQPKLKYALSKNRVNGRGIYQKTQTDRPRYASFVATTNNPHPLNDPTGSRRFLCVLIPAGKEIDNTLEINYGQLYAQVVHEVREQHLHYWFDMGECRAIEHDNLEFQHTADLGEMLNICFRKPTTTEIVQPMGYKQIFAVLNQQYPSLLPNASTKSRIGRILNEMGIKKDHTSHGPCYFLIPKLAA